MKRIILPILLVALLVPGVTLAKQNAEQNSNKNETQLQNQGETQQNMVQNENAEQESEGTENSVRTKVNDVSQHVRKLLADPQRQGGIGEQIKEVARAQNQTQEKIQEHLEKLESRKGLIKKILGPNGASIREIKQEMQQNRVRIQQLEKLEAKVTQLADSMEIDELISGIEEQNSALQEKIQTEEGIFSVFGWFRNLFK